ncbi:hypothetical protein LTS10_012006 [Elasticomyces elasticus]|nr:hypothetical protein LTS10_012006 [Elasticomyces elasticus]
MAQPPLTPATNASLLANQIRRIPLLLDAILDGCFREGLTQPLELDDPQERLALQALRLKIKLGLRRPALTEQRMWIALRFVDHLRILNSLFDTPPSYQPFIQNLVIVHHLDFNCSNSLAQSANHNFELDRHLVQNTDTAFLDLRTLVNNFYFDRDDLDNLDSTEEPLFRGALRGWIADIRTLQTTAATFQKSVVLTDVYHDRDDTASEVSIIGQTDDQVARALINNIGVVHRFL